MPKALRGKQKKRRAIDVGQSLAQLHRVRPPFSVGPDGKPSTFRSGLIDRCERLLVMPLRQFEPGDLRVMLHQQFYPETLVPLVLTLIEHEPLLDADLYPGDLLSGVLHQPSTFWASAPDLLVRVQAVAELALSKSELPESVRREIEHFREGTSLPASNVLK